VDTWQTHFAVQGVCAADIAFLARHIDDGPLGEQRRNFRAARATVPKRSRRRGPFSGEPPSRF